jgi:hypothetical protein
MSVYKNGIWNNNYMNNYSFQTAINPVIITEPDGSIWIQVLHHNNPASYIFSNSDSFANGVYKDTNRWAQFNLFDSATKWEILVKEKTTDTANESKFRWVQNYNPNIATYSNVAPANITFITTTGYTTPSSNYGGAYKVASANTYICCNNGTEGNWWGAFGASARHNGGIPAYNQAVVTTGYLDVYLRIDNDSLSITDKAKIFQNQDIVANDFIEI